LNLLGLLARSVGLAEVGGATIPSFFTLGAMACCAAVSTRARVLRLS
jgi:hypothetical protein